MKKDEASGLMLIDETAGQIEALDKLMQNGATIAAMKEGMVKAVKTANFIQQMKAALTDEVMGAIMSLQGSALGFKTDKDSRESSGVLKQGSGYPVEVVRECVIEAAAMGLGVTGNQFNIISNNMYVAKNGANTMLKNLGIKHFETPGIPEFHSEKDITYNDKFSGGTKTRKQLIFKQTVNVSWVDAEGEHSEDVSFLINVNNAMGPDAVSGKAIRKARMWLVTKVTGMEVADADVDDNAAPVDVTPEAEKPKGRFMKKEKPAPAQPEQKPADPAPRDPVTDAPELDPLRKALSDLRVTDVTAEEIANAYAQSGNPFDPAFAATKAIECVNWVRSLRSANAEGGDNGQQ
jgi:hypothetical protein